MPRIRAPNTAQRLTMLGPGRNWHNARRSLNSCAVIQPLFSTSIRRAHANTPPKLVIETPAKARHNAAIEGCGAATATTAEAASGSAGGTAEGVESDMPQRLTPDVIDGQTVHILKARAGSHSRTFVHSARRSLQNRSPALSLRPLIPLLGCPGCPAKPKKAPAIKQFEPRGGT